MRTIYLMRRSFLVVAFFISVVGLPQFAEAQIQAYQGRTMGTTYSVKTFGVAASDDLRIAIDAELRKVNDQMSTYLQSSEISRFNAFSSTDWFPVSPETAQVVDFALQVSNKTEGAFDVTVGPLVNLWGFGIGDRKRRVPDEDALKAIRSTIGYQHLATRLKPPALKKSIPELQIDLSSIAKGHGVDRIVKLLRQRGITNVFVEVGGEVRTSGSKDALPWKVGIQLPDTIASVAMIAHAMGKSGEDESMATSGDYRNYFEEDGKRYSHTIDPRTAKPIEHALASVSVVVPSCMAADAWATALNVLGPIDGLQQAKREQLNAFFIIRNGEKYKMTGTGTLAKYAFTDQAANEAATIVAATDSAPQGLGLTILMTAAVLGIIIVGMAVGVIFGRKSISGSCGGIAGKQNEDGSVACSLCSNPADACKELRERMQNSSVEG